MPSLCQSHRDLNFGLSLKIAGLGHDSIWTRRRLSRRIPFPSQSPGSQAPQGLSLFCALGPSCVSAYCAVGQAGRGPQKPRVDASWEVIAADGLRCNGSADFPVVFPRELRFSRFLLVELRRELQRTLSLIEISLNYFPPDNQPLTVE